MSGQTSVRDQAQGYAGQRVGFFHDSRTLQNDKGSARQTHRVTVDTAANGTAYQFEVDGKPVKYTSDASATIAEVRDGLIAAGRAIHSLEEVAFFNVETANSLLVTAVKPGSGFTLTETDANLSNTAIQANVTTEAIPFGRAIVRGTAGERSGTLPSTGGQRFEGVAERIHTNVDPTNAAGEITPFSDMSIGYRGEWLVEVEQDVALTDPVYFRHSVGAGGSQLGAWRKDADTATADLVPNARWSQAASAGGLAVLSLNVP